MIWETRSHTGTITISRDDGATFQQLIKINLEPGDYNIIWQPDDPDWSGEQFTVILHVEPEEGE